MYCYDKESSKLVQVSDQLGKEKRIIEGIAPWECHCKGIGPRLLVKEGYTLGSGLGRNTDGISNPIQRAPVKMDRLGLGMTAAVASMQPFKTHPLNDHWADLTNINVISVNPKSERLNTVEYYEENYSITIPPLTESTVQVRVREKGVGVCKARQIEEGVFSLTTIVKPVKGLAWIPVINFNADKRIIKN